MALSNGAEDNRPNHHQNYKIAEIDADARPPRLRRSVAYEIGTAVVRWLGGAGN